MTDDLSLLTVADAPAWRSWLGEHHAESSGVWLVLAKKGTTKPTSLTYDQALEEALCHGWVDGQLGRGDGTTFRRRFTPRRPNGTWSKRNIAIIDRLTSDGHMHPSGLAAVKRAKTDGSWDAAYEGQATIEVPDDLATALAAQPAAQVVFDALDRANRYAVLYRVTTARRAETRARRIEHFVAMLARGETIHPRAKQNPPLT